MPAASKPTTRTPAARSRNGTPVASRAATRRDVERQVARVEKLLGDVGDALQLLGKDMGRGAGEAYTELVRTAKALRRDAQRTNKRMLKDFDKLRDALTPSRATRRSSRSTATAGRARNANARSAPAVATRSARARTVASSEPSTEARRSRGTAGAASSTRTTRASRSPGTRTAAGSKRTARATRGRAPSNPKPTAG